MKVVHVVTLYSERGAYGGPLRVAVNQVKELQQRGINAIVLSGIEAKSPETSVRVSGVDVLVFPVRRLLGRNKFPGFLSVGLFQWLWRNLEPDDVMHVHAAREIIPLSSIYVGLLRRCVLVAQCHGMVAPDSRFAVKLIDAAFVRPILGRVSCLLCLTQNEKAGFQRIFKRASPSLREIKNGVSLRDHGVVEQATDNEIVDILYCARFNARKRPMQFVEHARSFGGSNIQFSMVGPDGGQLEEIVEEIGSCDENVKLRYEGTLKYDDVGARLSKSDVYVLPSVDEPFPMSVIEAMCVGVPVIVTDQTGLSVLIASYNAGLVTDGSLESLVSAVRSLVACVTLRRTLSANARELVRRELSIEGIADELLDSIYVHGG